MEMDDRCRNVRLSVAIQQGNMERQGVNSLTGDYREVLGQGGPSRGPNKTGTQGSFRSRVGVHSSVTWEHFQRGSSGSGDNGNIGGGHNGSGLRIRIQYPKS